MGLKRFLPSWPLRNYCVVLPCGYTQVEGAHKNAHAPKIPRPLLKIKQIRRWGYHKYIYIYIFLKRKSDMNMWPLQLNRNLSNCEVARKNSFLGFNGIRNPWPLLSRSIALPSEKVSANKSRGLAKRRVPIHHILNFPWPAAKVNGYFSKRHSSYHVLNEVTTDLNPLSDWGGGGQTLNVNNFFNIKTNATKLSDFF